MIQEKVNFTDRGLAFDKSFGDKNRKPVPESGFKAGECYVVRSENFTNPMECKILKIYDYSAMVEITKTVGNHDKGKAIELNHKAIIPFKKFMFGSERE